MGNFLLSTMKVSDIFCLVSLRIVLSKEIQIIAEQHSNQKHDNASQDTLL